MFLPFVFLIMQFVTTFVCPENKDDYVVLSLASGVNFVYDISRKPGWLTKDGGKKRTVELFDS